jgi:hypothetical protein
MNDNIRDFNADDLLSPGEITPLEIQRPDGSTGLVYHQGLPAGDILDFVGIEEGPERNEALLRLVAKAVCDRNGKPLFKDRQLDRLRNMSIGVFSQMAEAVTNAAGIQSGEAEAGNP